MFAYKLIFDFYQQHGYNLPMKTRQPTWIMLSGLPCSGKTTWRGQFLAAATARGLKVRVLSGDELALQLCEEHNRGLPPEKHLYYNTLFKDPTQVAALENKFKEAVIQAKQAPLDFIVLDRTYLTRARRKGVLELIGPGN